MCTHVVCELERESEKEKIKPFNATQRCSESNLCFLLSDDLYSYL